MIFRIDCYLALEITAENSLYPKVTIETIINWVILQSDQVVKSEWFELIQPFQFEYV